MKVVTVIPLLFLLFVGTGFAQSEQALLEKKRKTLLNDIKEINILIQQQKRREVSVLTKIEETNQKIMTMEQLISITNQKINFFNIEVKNNENRIKRLRKDVKILKDDYAGMIRQSYKSRSEQNRLMFLLSSKDFYQAYNRILYMKQYARYRKRQGLSISEKMKKIEMLNKSLKNQLNENKVLKKENVEVNAELQQEKNNQKKDIQIVRRNERGYKKKMHQKQLESQKIDREIEHLIRLTIAESNKGSKSKTSTFRLDEIAGKRSKTFYISKGKIPWPVDKGVKVRGFGQYSDPIYPNVKYYNNGITIATPRNTAVKSVFEGEVSAILIIPGGKKAVQVRHGEYITTYYNLSKILAKKGDTVSHETPIGYVSTDNEGKTELKFFLYKNTKRLNPEKWIKKR